VILLAEEKDSVLLNNCKKNTKSTEKSPKNTVGTDLRKLSLEKTKGILMDLGVPDEDIQALKRWDQIKLISKISTERTQAGETNQKYLQFVGKKKKRKTHQEAYNERFQKIFDSQVRALSDPDPEISDDEENNEELDELALNIEKDLEAKIIEKKNNNIEKVKLQKKKELEVDEERLYGGIFPSSSTGKTKKSETTMKITSIHPKDQVLVKITPGPNQQYIIKKIHKDPNTQAITKIEIITDPDHVENIIETQEKKKKVNKRVFRTQEEEAKLIEERKEKRRLQERMRRERRIQEQQKVLQNRLKEGSDDGSLPNGNANLTCSRCGMMGHIKTNKSCPLFGTDDEGDNDVPVVKKSGEGRIKIVIKQDRKKSEPNDINILLDKIYKKMLKNHSQYCEPFLQINEKYTNSLTLSTIKEKISNRTYTLADELLDDLDDIKKLLRRYQ